MIQILFLFYLDFWGFPNSIGSIRIRMEKSRDPGPHNNRCGSEILILVYFCRKGHLGFLLEHLEELHPALVGVLLLEAALLTPLSKPGHIKQVIMA